MKRPLLTPRRALLSCAAILFFLSLLPARVAAGVALAPQVVLTVLLAPVSRTLKSASDTVRRPSELRLVDKSHEQLLDEYGRALQHIRKLETDLADSNTRLARLTESKVEGLSQIDARVTAYGGDPTDPVIKIDKGESKGIVKNLAVVWGSNLVGIIRSAGPVSAEVRPIDAPQTRLWVEISPPVADPTRRLDDELRVSSEGRFFTLEVALDAEVEVGDLAHLADVHGQWPPEARGFIVGKVVAIDDRTDKPLSLKRVVVRPLISPARLSRVTVLMPIQDP